MKSASVITGIDHATAAIARAERLLEQRRYVDTVASLASVHVPAVPAPGLAARVLYCEASARRQLGELAVADALCERARALSTAA